MNENTEEQKDEMKAEHCEASAAGQPLLCDVNGLTGDSKANYDEWMEFLNKYEQDDKLTHADIYHLYSQEIAYPNGYYDSRFFNLVAYNTKTMKKRMIEGRDGIHVHKNAHIYLVRIFIDGSTLLRFNKPEIMDIFQCVEIGEMET